MTTVAVTPTLGSAPVTLQAGNYSAIDDRRFWSAGLGEGYLSTGSYQVIQRAAGANMSVDVQMSSGDGAIVTGDSVTAQGRYFVPPTPSNGNVTIAAADATNPRNDLVVLEVKDDQHDAGGLNQARVRVITGTPNASAALTDSPGTNGTPALPVSCMPLAVVRVAAAATSIATAAISDRRPAARPYALLGSTTSTTTFITSATHTAFQDDTPTISVTYAAARRLRVTYATAFRVPGGANGIGVSLVRGSTQIVLRDVAPAAVEGTNVLGWSIPFTFNGPVAGATETFKVQVRGSVNNTSIESFASTDYIKSLTVEDLGPQ
jgi:hypothetical protein